MCLLLTMSRVEYARKYFMHSLEINDKLRIIGLRYKNKTKTLEHYSHVYSNIF